MCTLCTCIRLAQLPLFATTIIMGIDGFGKFLRQKVPGAFIKLPMDHFRGSRMAFDMHQWLYQAFYRNGGDHYNALRDINVLTRTLHCLAVTATFVFDGNTYGLKPRAHRERSEASKVATSAAKEVESVHHATEYQSLEEYFVASETVQRKKAQASKPSMKLFEDAKRELAKYGKVITADDDAERLIAHLAATGEVDHAVSKDYDTLVFGAPAVVLEFPFYWAPPVSPDKKEDTPAPLVVETLQLQRVLAGLGFQRLSQLQDMAILAGCDYTEKIPGIGPAIAHRLITAHKTIERVIATASIRGRVPAEFNAPFARARFMGTDPQVHVTVPVLVTVPVPVPVASLATATCTTTAAASAATAMPGAEELDDE